MEKHEVSCDTCGQDLTTTGNCVGYRTVVKSEARPTRGGVVTAMMVYPQFETPLHFCGCKCMKQWAMSYFKLREEA